MKKVSGDVPSHLFGRVEVVTLSAGRGASPENRGKETDPQRHAIFNVTGRKRLPCTVYHEILSGELVSPSTLCGKNAQKKPSTKISPTIRFI